MLVFCTHGLCERDLHAVPISEFLLAIQSFAVGFMQSLVISGFFVRLFAPENLNF